MIDLTYEKIDVATVRNAVVHDSAGAVLIFEGTTRNYFEGKQVFFCCATCVRIWNKNPKYIIKAMPKLLPQFAGMDEKLGLDKVKLLEQRMCPIYNERVVTPDSPTIEIEGKKVYLYNKSALRKWNKSPEKYLAKALEGGLLLQLAGNKAKKS